jgi:Flp pilus assembly protein TadG
MIMMICCIIGLFGLLALAIEIGTVAVARSQAQNAADGSALAGARTINGDSTNNYNLGSAPAGAVKAATKNSILSTSITGDYANVPSTGTDAYATGQVSLVLGTYGYNYNDNNPSLEGFSPALPRPSTSTEPYSAVRSTITGSANLSFARVFGLSSRSVQATAVAVHRPRDVFIIMDLSGSMRFQSLLGSPHSGARANAMNPDPDYPKFGHYSDTTNSRLYGNTSIATGSGEYYDPANISYTSNSGPPILEDFYANAVGVTPSSSNRAFTRKSADYANTPNGDNYLKTSLNTGTDYAYTLHHYNNSSSGTIPKYEINGYAYKTGSWSGYTEGPSYWGKTFFIWPPNPGFGGTWAGSFPMPTSLTDTSFKWHTWGDTNPRDWRQRFFVGVNTGVAASNSDAPRVIQHNSILFSTSSGQLRTPGSTRTIAENGTDVVFTYRINYAAILYWLQQSPVHFPSTIQAGRIRYYTAIPDGSETALNNRWWTTAPNALPNNERFWKHYIDFVLGLQVADESESAYTYSDISSLVGSGDFFTWNNIQVGTRSDRPSATSYVNMTKNPTSPYTTGTTGPYQSSTTGPYQSTTTTSNPASTGANSVSLNTTAGIRLPTAPVANTNYVMFGTSLTAPSYKITNSSTSSLSVNPNLSANVNIGSAAKIYSTNNVVGVTGISVNTLSYQPLSTSDPENDYVGFNGSTSTYYALTGTASFTQLTLTTGLAAALNLNGDSVQVYASSGAAGKTQISVTGLTATPVVSDWLKFDSDTTNQYVISAVDGPKANGSYILTLSGGLVNAVNINGTGVKIYSPYMVYSDNVARPRYQFWFGGMTFVDWLGNYNTNKFWWPGNVHEAQAWACKVGIQTAIDDIKNNHPNDFIGMTFFSNPMNSRTDSSGFHNRAVVALGRNYQQLKDSLWFPPTTVTGTATEITPYDTDMSYVPRANGGTTPSMGFMIAYNQLSNSVDNLRLYATPNTTYRGNAGGLGRKGSNRVIIFETDGAPNTSATATLYSSGANSYYPIRIQDPTSYSSTSNTEWPGGGGSISVSSATTEVQNIVQQICALETASPPGYSTTRQSALVYPIGYGSLFDPNNSSTNQTNALNFMQTVAYYGKTATSTDGANFPDMFRIYGTNTQRITRMQTAFTSIMQSGTQVSLIE